MILQPNILLISGSGQNTGKTTLACKLIEYFSGKSEITGVKISPHFHLPEYSIPKIIDAKEFIIYEETERNKPKDSSRMLKAGAKRVFFIISENNSTGVAMNDLLGILSPATAIICESGGLGDYYKPGLHLYLKGSENKNINHGKSDIIVIKYNGTTFNLDFDKIAFKNNSWKINY